MCGRKEQGEVEEACVCVVVVVVVVVVVGVGVVVFEIIIVRDADFRKTNRHFWYNLCLFDTSKKMTLFSETL